MLTVSLHIHTAIQATYDLLTLTLYTNIHLQYLQHRSILVFTWQRSYKALYDLWLIVTVVYSGTLWTSELITYRTVGLALPVPLSIESVLL